ncbi:5-formyltetrahydrofolate cyclo-ligase [Thermomonospora echinospora]|uniref:5-formyltetrahydrofolate cyclo-ligase n=1 Tax=Thermomonospora echinospora TaxID=1992 RepID=A0A1H6AXA5_9ACTN|nr:5-formyltetrahydrofolate cyclo-ligase [Thermomonospora echinospora]SEG52436.1 5-formyltetrahydrofolate cyclo-ligase [Thermomonospora echinospora]
MDIKQAKQEVRERIWDLLEREKAVREPGVHGHIPDFIGSERAADLLATLPAWKSAQVIMCNPDRAQLPVRIRALEEGKLVYMAVPNLADEHPFYELDPTKLSLPPSEAATSKVAATVAPKVNVDTIRPIDLFVCGSVAVNRDGARLGKGAGYSDIEFALVRESDLIGPGAVVVTTVHVLQVVDGPLPESAHDFRVDFIITPDVVAVCDTPFAHNM